MIPLFGPGWGNYAIRGIREIALPEPTSLWPETPGWWLLLALLLVWLLRGGWASWRRYQHNRYRREALAQLQHLRQRVAAGEEEALRELAPLLRATAMAASSRSRLAASRDAEWASALRSLTPRDAAPLPLRRLHDLAYLPLERCDTRDPGALFSALENWVLEHEGGHA